MESALVMVQLASGCCADTGTASVGLTVQVKGVSDSSAASRLLQIWACLAAAGAAEITRRHERKAC